RANFGEVVFTPDGEIGLVASTEDGSVGIFKFDASGAPVVINPKYKDGFYASKIVMDPSGERFYVVDQNWPENGGGVFSVRLGCDGTPHSEGKVFSSKNSYALNLIAARPGQVFLFAPEALNSPADTNAHLLSWGAPPTLVASVNAFADDDAIVPDGRVTPDGRWALIADNNAYSGTGIRVAVVELQAQALRRVQTLSPFTDPVQVVPSPYGNAALVVEGEGNHIKVLDLDPSNANAPFSIVGALSYVGRRPQLPYQAVVMDRGTLRGRVLVSELEGIRQVQFQPDGTVTDLGLTPFLSGMEGIAGAMGVQP
ncbi:MAG: hypothetical protein HY901_25115, partial [Deltaproteobacteria bacterium]|nr:hypothetical protein [Deltaproteobacteria bacterium]